MLESLMTLVIYELRMQSKFSSSSRSIFFCDVMVLESICYCKIAKRLKYKGNTTGWLKNFGRALNANSIPADCSAFGVYFTA